MTFFEFADKHPDLIGFCAVLLFLTLVGIAQAFRRR